MRCGNRGQTTIIKSLPDFELKESEPLLFLARDFSSCKNDGVVFTLET